MEEKLNMDEKVTVTNIAPWNVAFPNLASTGDTCIQPNSQTRMRREEIVQQVASGNRLLAGIDGQGSHATIIIEDKPTREYLEFESEENKITQNVISTEKISHWFSLKTDDAFERNIRENVKTRAEKQFLLKSIKDLKINDHKRIEFCNGYCKFTFVGI